MNLLSLFQTNQLFHCFEFHDLASWKTQDVETECVDIKDKKNNGKESTSLAHTRYDKIFWTTKQKTKQSKSLYFNIELRTLTNI